MTDGEQREQDGGAERGGVDERVPGADERAPGERDVQTGDDTAPDAPTGDDDPAESGPADDAAGASEVADLERRLQEQEQLAGQRLDDLKRLKADFDNYRRRMTREQSRWRRQALTDFVADLLPVRDNLLRALDSVKGEAAAGEATPGGEDDAPSAAADGDGSGLRQGVEMTLKQLDQVLVDAGIEAVEPVGEPFDPRFHEAMLQEHTENEPHNTVLEVFQTGFRLEDRVIRPAMVKVAKNPAGAEDGGDEPRAAAEADSDERKEA